MTDLLEMVQRVADNDATVLIRGESGTGKDLITRALHFMGAHRDGPFVPVNCAAIPESLLESELFGYVRGAFTDARQGKGGLFQAARNGTLFLDEVGELPPSLQAKLLRVIEDKMVRPLGATEELPVKVRIITATNSDLDKLIEEGRFRIDLYYRLAAVTLEIPPLRERPDDIDPLVNHFLKRAASLAGSARAPKLEPDALECLRRYSWPGNVRELQHAVQHGVMVSRNGIITRRDLPAKITGYSEAPLTFIEQAVNRRLTAEQLEREYVRAVLASVGGNKSEAAAILEIDRKTLYRKLQDDGDAIEKPGLAPGERKS